MQSKPYCKSRQLACENRYYKVFFDQIQDTSGNIIDDYLMLARKRKSTYRVTGAAVLRIVKNRYALSKSIGTRFSVTPGKFRTASLRTANTTWSRSRVKSTKKPISIASRILFDRLDILRPKQSARCKHSPYVARVANRKRLYHIQEMGQKELSFSRVRKCSI